MGRTGKWLLGGSAALLGVALIGVLVIATHFDWNRARPWIDDKVTQALGRPFHIEGDLKLGWRRPPGETGWRAWVPWPQFSAERIVIGNPSWAKQPQFATLERIDFEVAALPLLDRRIEVPVISLVNPALDLERRKDGSNNWTFKLPSGQPSAWQLQLNDIAFAKGTVGYRDEQLNADLRVTIDTLGKPIPFGEVMQQQAAESRSGKGAVKDGQQPVVTSEQYALGLTVNGQYKGVALQGDGKVGGLLALQDAGRPFPLHVRVSYGTTRVAAVGTLTDPLHLAALDLRLWLSGVSLSQLYPLTGIILPATPPYATDGHLVGQLKAGASRFEYQHFTGRVGGSDLGGSLTFEQRKPRPRLSGELVSTQLRFVDLAPLIGADSKASKRQRGDTSVQPAGKLLPTEPFKTESWNTLDADVRFSGQRILRPAALPIQNLQTHLLLQDGVLRLDPLRFGVAGGTLEGKIQLDSRHAPMQGRIDMSARHVKLKQLFATQKAMQNSLGELQGDAALSATGNSVAALLGSSNGEVKMLMHDGAISGSLLEEAGLNIANVVVYKLFGDKTVKIHCAAMDFTARQGQLDSKVAALDTEDALVTVQGRIDMARERLNLTVKPQAKGLRLLSLRSPLYVRGSFAKPDVGVEAAPLLLRGGAALGLVLLAPPLAALLPLTALTPAQDNACHELFTQLRGTKR